MRAHDGDGDTQYLWRIQGESKLSLSKKWRWCGDSVTGEQ